MNLLRPAAGRRALRLLTLTSALILAACGGGGGSDKPEAPSTGLSTEITSETQVAVAADVGTIVSSLNPTAMFTLFTLIPPTTTVVSVHASAEPTTVVMANPSALLVAAARKFAPTASATRMAAAVATTEDVECTSGSGTVKQTESETVDGFSATITVELDNCATTLGSLPVVMNGKLYLKGTGSESAQNVELVAVEYSVRGDGFKTLVDGDMQLALSGTRITVAGKRLTTSQVGTPATLVAAAETMSDSRTMTLRDYRQTIRLDEDSIRVESQATVETDAFGAVSTYELSTPQALVYASGLFKSGQFKVVGAGGTILYITANGDGTFKLERDDGGDGSIDDKVTPIDPEDLNLHAPFGPLPA